MRLSKLGGLVVSIFALFLLFSAALRLLSNALGVGDSRSLTNVSSASSGSSDSLDSSDLIDQSVDKAWRDDLTSINYEINRDTLYSDHTRAIEDSAQLQSWEELQQEREALDFEIMSIHESMLSSNGFEPDHILTDEQIEELGLDWFDVRESEALIQRYADDDDDDKDFSDSGSENQKSEPVDSLNSVKNHVS